MSVLTTRGQAAALGLVLCASLVACEQRGRDAEPQAGPGAMQPAPAQTDASITTSVQSTYYRDDLLRGRQIDVNTQNGVVTLEGTVRDQAVKQRAVSIAEGVAGVTRVDDQLEVQPDTAAGNTRTPGPRTPGQQPTGTAGTAADRIEAGWITTKINAQYFVNRDVSPLNIDVTTSSAGVVTLSGEVETPTQKAEAVRIARDTDGVSRVEDRLRVKGETRAAEHGAADAESGIDRPDAWLTTKVQSKYFLDPDVKGRNINVDTNDHVVTLTGTVGSEAERRQAVALARNTDGVRSVTDRLEVRSDAPAPDRDEPIRPVRTLDQAAADTMITTTIQSKYFLDEQIKKHEIQVESRKGLVTLKGEVPDAAVKQEAERIARETDGVAKVNNQLAVKAG